MATLIADQAQLKELLAKHESIVAQAGMDTDLDAVSKELLPGETAAERAGEFGKLIQSIFDLRAGIDAKRDSALLRAQLAAEGMKDGASGESQELRKANVLGLGSSPTLTLKEWNEIQADDNWENPYAKLVAAGFGQPGFRMSLAGPQAMKAIVTTPASAQVEGGIELLPQEVYESPLYRQLNFLSYVKTVPTNADTYHFRSFAYPSAQADRAGVAARGTEREITLVSSAQAIPLKTIRVTQDIAMESLNDAPRMMSQVNEMLTFDVRQFLEKELLAGDNSADALNGLSRQLTGNDTAAAQAADNPHLILVNKVVELVEKGAAPTCIIMGAANWGQVFNTLLTSGAAAGVIGAVGTGMAPMNVLGVNCILSSSLAANDVIVYSPMAYCLVMRQGVMVDVSDEAAFKNYAAVVRVVARAAGVYVRDGAAFKYTAFNVAAANYRP